LWYEEGISKYSRKGSAVMTKENQEIRDSLKAAESVIVSALAHQPEEDEACLEHLLEAKRKVLQALGYLA
jgi:hypothetical protein